MSQCSVVFEVYVVHVKYIVFIVLRGTNLIINPRVVYLAKLKMVWQMLAVHERNILPILTMTISNILFMLFIISYITLLIKKSRKI